MPVLSIQRMPDKSAQGVERQRATHTVSVANHPGKSCIWMPEQARHDELSRACFSPGQVLAVAEQYYE